VAEPARIIDHGLERQRADRTDARNAHEVPTQFAPAHDRDTSFHI